MLDLKLDRDLENRLTIVARRQGRSPEECVLAAIRSYVADCEEAAQLARQLSGGETMMRPPDGFYD